MKIVVVDTETGGLDSAVDSIVTLGAAIFDGGELKSTFHVNILEAELHISNSALKVNGLSEEKIKTGVTPSFAVTMFEQYLHNNGIMGRTMLAGHNIAGFDMGFLKRLYRLAERKYFPFDYHTIDTMTAAIFLRFAGKLAVENVKLDTLAAHFGIQIREPGKAHNASEDAVAAGKVLFQLLKLLEPAPATESTE